MTEPVVGGLPDQATVAERVDAGEAPDWVAAHWRTFRDGLLGEQNGTPFPCFFGAGAVRQAREIIQDRLEGYDGVCPHADLGDWGTESDREWRQYVLSSDTAAAPEQCPITVTREHPKSDRPAGVGDRHPGQVVR